MQPPRTPPFLALILVLFTGCSRPSATSADADAPGSGSPSRGPALAVVGRMVDDFSGPDRNSVGIERQFIDDTTAGGRTRTRYRVEGGVLLASGEIVPPRGQPGWASVVLAFDPAGRPRDASAHTGLRLVLRVNRGSLSVSANSPEVTNFDYHAAPVVVPSDGRFHEVRIPFGQLKRMWSEPTPLNPASVASISLVAFGLQSGPFDFAVDEVSFY